MINIKIRRVNKPDVILQEGNFATKGQAKEWLQFQIPGLKAGTLIPSQGIIYQQAYEISISEDQIELSDSVSAIAGDIRDSTLAPDENSDWRLWNQKTDRGSKLYFRSGDETFLLHDSGSPIEKSSFAAMATAYVNSVKPRSRPSSNTGKGFFVVDGKIYDKNGWEFVMRGANSCNAWHSPTVALPSIAEQAKAGANATRIVMGFVEPLWAANTGSPAKKRELIQAAINAKLVPVIELHEATAQSVYDKPFVGFNNTSDRCGLKQIVDHWLEPEILAILKEFEDKIILNIANEYGGTLPGGGLTNWKQDYITSIARLRAASVNCLLMVDTNQAGQDPFEILKNGKEILNADPQKNVCFALHEYGAAFQGTGIPPNNWSANHLIDNIIPQFQESGLAVIIGEFAWYLNNEGYTYEGEYLVKLMTNYGLGYFFWGWVDRLEEPRFCMVNTANHQFNSNADLTPAGQFLVNDPKYGWKNGNSKRCSIFN